MITQLDEDPKAALKGKEAAVVVFCSPWCPDCSSSLEYERKLAKEFSGKVEFFRLDADELDTVADSYGVERYPTFILFRKGKPMRGALVEPVSEGEARNWLEIKLSHRRR
jgi:thioredoxin 1